MHYILNVPKEQCFLVLNLFVGQHKEIQDKTKLFFKNILQQEKYFVHGTGFFDFSQSNQVLNNFVYMLVLHKFYQMLGISVLVALYLVL